MMLNEACRKKLEELLGPLDTKVCDFTSAPSMIVHLFKNCTSPSITKSARGKVDLPDSFTVRIGGSNSIYALLGDPSVLVQFPVLWIKAFLDTISVILSRGVVNVIRFQCVDEAEAEADAEAAPRPRPEEEEEQGGRERAAREGGLLRGVDSAAAAALLRQRQSRQQRQTLIRTLLDLLEHCEAAWGSDRQADGLPVLKRVVHLIGLAATAGLTTVDVKDLLSLLQAPSALTVPLLQALKKMLGSSSAVAKANPMSFFNLGGRGSGITSAAMPFPFAGSEYQMFTWFRVEEFENIRLAWPAMTADTSAARTAEAKHTPITDATQHIISVMNDNKRGIDVYIQSKVIHVHVALGQGHESVHIILDGITLRRGVWYHFALRHQKAARLSMFAKDEMVIRLDHQVMFQDVVTFPDAAEPALAAMQYKIGQNFDGQITPVYFLREIQTDSVLETMARIDAGKSLAEAGVSAASGGLGAGEDGSQASRDSAGTSAVSKRKMLDMMGIGFANNAADVFSQEATFKKILSAYYPDRCLYNHALDICGGMHAKFGKNTHAWSMAAARDVFGSIGGVSCILPMLPRLLIDNYNPSPSRACDANINTASAWGSPGGNAKALVVGGAIDEKDMYDVLETEPMNNLLAELHEGQGDSCISLILMILAKILNNHKLYQRELAQISGVEMIEYALTAAPGDSLNGEGESVVSALKLLRSSLAGNAHLDVLVVKNLLLNLKVWSRASFQMQRSLLRVIYAYATSEPIKFGGLVDVHLMLEHMVNLYCVEDARSSDAVDSAGDGDSTPIGTDEQTQELGDKFAAQSIEDEANRVAVSESDSDGDDEDDEMMPAALVPVALPSSRDAAVEGNLTAEEKQIMRCAIQNVIMSVIQSNANPQGQLQSIIDFMASYKNPLILNEVANILLVLIVEGGRKIMSCLIESCHGAEELASFVLRSLVHQPNEELRCTGIRIITHFYLRADLISKDMVKMTLKKKKGGNIVTRAMEQLKETLETESIQGLERLQACGGIALLCEIITSHKESSTFLTYKVLLELLLSKPNQGSRVEVANIALSVDDIVRNPLQKQEDSSNVTVYTSRRRVGDFNVQFMAPDQLTEEESDINAVVLPLFLEVLPKLNLGNERQRVYSDLLSLLKHSESNRTTFCSSMSWHICLHDLMAQLVIVGKDDHTLITPEQLGREVDLWAEYEGFVTSGDLRFKKNAILQSPLNFNKAKRQHKGEESQNFDQFSASAETDRNSTVTVEDPKEPHLTSSLAKLEMKSTASVSDLDIWFAIGMKVYSTLLIHSVEYKGGWREVSRTISQSLDTEFAFLVTQSVLSHLVSEQTFVMQWKYKDLQAKAASKIDSDNSEALSYMNNTFSVIITVGQYALHDTYCMTDAILDWKVAKLRLLYIKEIVQEIKNDRAKNKQHYSKNQFDMEYLQELAENRLIERVNQRRSKTAASSGLNMVSGHSMGLDSQTVSMVESDLALSHPYLQHVNDFLSFEAHKWVDLGSALDQDQLPGAGAAPAPNVANAGNSGSNSEFVDFTDTGMHSISTADFFSFNYPDTRFNVSMLLHPLERGTTVASGRLVLVLQNLRLFDSFFWPNDEDMLRNSPMLRFHKEREHEEPVEGKTPTMTLLFSAISQSLFVLGKLSPLNDLATKNVNRLHALIESVDNVSAEVAPLDDLVLTILAHITFSLQRLNAALANVFTVIGIRDPVKISNTGIVLSHEEAAEEERTAKEELLFNKIYGDKNLVKHIENYFNNSAGEHLFAFILASFMLLVTAFDKKKDKFSEAGLDERTFGLLESLVGRVNFDLEYFHTHAADNKRGPEWAKQKKEQEQRRKQRENSKLVDGYGDIFKNMIPTADSESDEDDDEDKAKPRKKKGPQRGAGSLMRDKISYLKEHETERGTLAIGALRGPLIIKSLQWMRDAYFTCNLNKNVGVATVLASMERIEHGCNKAYLQDMSKLNKAMHEARDFSSKSIAEMSNLNNLSGHVSKLLAKRGNARRQFQASVEMHKLKSVAKNWNDSIRTFGADWSPWHQTKVNQKDSFELSRHKDSVMMQRLLVSAPHPIDHDDAAYLEGKQRDQMVFEMEEELRKNGVKDASNTVKAALLLESSKHAEQDSPFSSILKNLSSSVSSSGNTTSSDAKNLWNEEEDEGDGGEYSSWDRAEPAGMGGMGGMGVHGGRTMSTGDSDAASNRQSGNKITNPLLFAASINKIARPPWTEKFHWAATEKPLMQLEASRITVDKTISGILLLTNEYLYFHPVSLVGGLAMQGKTAGSTVISLHDRRWSLGKLREFYGRRYLLQNCAIELFFQEDFDILFALNNFTALQKLFRMLRHQRMPLMKSPNNLNPRVLIRNSPYTELWRHRQISNFEYLMRLNMLAGRSYSDITQYPVFPWVLADYESATLDLSGNTPGVFRDLSKPIGALNESRLHEILERYSSFDADTPINMRFMYGSHYSSAGVVIFFLLRQEPFTSLAINLQGGRFDCPDRLFFDVAQAWRGAMTSVSDVKELIPEMYSCPEIFINSNKLPLGHLQEGAANVDDVVLPPWANGSPFEFVRIMREALESDYVSEHLHEWIDLIFGYKQTGSEAVNASNLFYYLTYEGAIDINAIADPVMKEAAKAQVTYYGQTPSQLFKTPHEKRLPSGECMRALCSDEKKIGKIMAFTPQAQFGQVGSRGAVIGGCCSSDRLAVLHADLTVCTYSWSSFPDGEGVPFESRPLKAAALPCANMSVSEDILQRRSYAGKEAEVYGNKRPNAMQAFGKALSGWFAGTAEKNMQAFDAKISTFTASSASGDNSPNDVAPAAGSGKAADIPWASMVGKQSRAEVTAPKASGGSSADLSKRNANTNTNTNPHPERSRGIFKNSAEYAARSLRICHRKVGLTIDSGAGKIFTSGYWDNSMKVLELDTLKSISDSGGGHIGPVMCLHSGDKAGKCVISGGRDGTLRYWIDGAGAAGSAPEQYEHNQGGADGDTAVLPGNQGMVCVRTMWGHTSPITCIYHSADLGIIVSASSDGLICVHTVRNGQFVRAIRNLVGQTVDDVLVCPTGYLLASSKSERKLYLFWLNGQHLQTVTTETEIETLMVNGAGNVLVCGMADGMVEMRSLTALEPISEHDLTSHGSVTAMWCTLDQQFIIVGSSDGTFTVLTDPEERWRLLHAAISKTPMLSALG